ncbi:37S ribosomal protein S19- mitochondrial [Apiospora hydei]|uniref:37S ribosomal protein S19- mitochondrial n=1 Tax=Apiospora hydei TaxID=1337664 RepID=A0ABR1XEB9_9PEZI
MEIAKLTAHAQTGPHIVPLPIVRPMPGEKIKPIKTQARSATILPSFVGLVFQVHNGKVYNDVVITEDMVGHKLGEFSMYVSYPTLTRGLRNQNQRSRISLTQFHTICRTRKPFIWSRG